MPQGDSISDVSSVSGTGERLFAYLDITHPMVAWEVAIGRIQSAGETKNDSFSVSLWAYSLLQSYVRQQQPIRSANELRLEAVRLQYHPTHVSRLRGLYFFKSKEDASVALDRWCMPQKKQFISEVEFFCES
jgi:hypothetical protein